MAVKSKMKLTLSVIALGCAGAAIYIIPYIRGTFYDLEIAATGMNNTQLAFLSSVMAMTGLFLSVPIGTIADKMNNKKVVFWSLNLVTLVTLLFAFFFQTYFVGIITWFFLGIFTGFYWVCFSKILNVIGAKTDKEETGKSGMSFGFYYMVNGIVSAIISAVALAISERFSDPVTAFRAVCLTCAAGTVIAAVIVHFFLDDELCAVDDTIVKVEEKNEFTGLNGLQRTKIMLRNPMIWCFAVVSFSIFAMNTLQQYFTPYLTNVVGITTTASSAIAIIRTYLFYLLAPLGGIIADKVFHSTTKWMGVVFILLFFLTLGLFLMPSGANPMMVAYYTLLPAAILQMSYTIRFSCIPELNVAPYIIAAATGLFTTFGSLTNLVISPAIAACLDLYGNDGYRYLFIVLLVVLALGCVCSFLIVANKKKHMAAAEKAQQSAE